MTARSPLARPAARISAIAVLLPVPVVPMIFEMLGLIALRNGNSGDGNGRITGAPRAFPLRADARSRLVVEHYRAAAMLDCGTTRLGEYSARYVSQTDRGRGTHRGRKHAASQR